MTNQRAGSQRHDGKPPQRPKDAGRLLLTTVGSGTMIIFNDALAVSRAGASTLKQTRFDADLLIAVATVFEPNEVVLVLTLTGGSGVSFAGATPEEEDFAYACLDRAVSMRRGHE